MIIECDVRTGKVTTRECTEAEAAEFASRAAADAEYNTLDNRAARAIGTYDRLQFEILFELENRTRALEAKPAITRDQYRTALINRWKVLNQ